MSVSEKVSVSIGKEELRQARRLAAKLGLSLSTFVTKAVREQVAEQERREAGQAVLAGFPVEDRATPDEMAVLLERWAAPAQAVRPRPYERRASSRGRS